MRTRAATWVAWSLCLLCVALAAGSLLLSSLNGYSLREIVVEDVLAVVVLTTTFSIVGALIASHRPKNPIGWIFCAAALFQGLNVFGDQYATYALITRPGSLPIGVEVSWLKEWIWFPGLALILVFLPLLFPDGRPPSPRWRPVAWLGGALIILFSVFASILGWRERGKALLGSGQTGDEGPGWLLALAGSLFGLMLLAALAAVISLLVRFWRARGEERQQIKWFSFAAVLMFTFIIAFEVLPTPDENLLFVVLGMLAVASIPVAVGIAILKHRLYDIDVIVNRALVYGSLTAALVAVYFGGVATTQTTLRTLAGQEQQPQLAIVISTLVIAALFNPLRRRIQSFIDRRFYRSKYDAVKTLEAFSAKLRDETDLDTLNNHLVEVVKETMQPAHVSLWLRPDTPPNGEQLD